MDWFALIKTVHVACAALSFAGFGIRSVLGIVWGRDYRCGPWRWLPHVNDSLLLSAAVALAVSSGQYPFARPWLTIKLVAVVGYIVAGWWALDLRRPRGGRIAAAIAALGCFASVVWIAVRRGSFGG